LISNEERSSFSQETRHRLVEDFAMAYLNGSVKPDVAERNPTDGRAIEYLMDGPQFGRLNKEEVWSYSNAAGTGYQYRVTYRDKRFSDLDNLLGMYTGRVRVEDDDMPVVEQRLYEQILVLIKEGRLPKNFKIQSPKDPRVDKLVAELEQLKQVMDRIDERVRRLENQSEVKEGSALLTHSDSVS
jgi:hypothetical protein